jgi:hypothetical protein
MWVNCFSYLLGWLLDHFLVDRGAGDAARRGGRARGGVAGVRTARKEAFVALRYE